MSQSAQQATERLRAGKRDTCSHCKSAKNAERANQRKQWHQWVHKVVVDGEHVEAGEYEVVVDGEHVVHGEHRLQLGPSLMTANMAPQLVRRSTSDSEHVVHGEHESDPLTDVADIVDKEVVVDGVVVDGVVVEAHTEPQQSDQDKLSQQEFPERIVPTARGMVRIWPAALLPCAEARRELTRKRDPSCVAAWSTKISKSNKTNEGVVTNYKLNADDCAESE